MRQMICIMIRHIRAEWQNIFYLLEEKKLSDDNSEETKRCWWLFLKETKMIKDVREEY